MRQRSSQGFVLVTALTFLVGMSTLMAAAITRSITERVVAGRAVAMEQALHLTEAGADTIARWLQNRSVPPGCPGNSYPCTLSTAQYPSLPVAGALPTGTYTISVLLPASNADSAMDSYQVTVTATSANPSLTRTLQYRLRTESFARFTYFTNAETTKEGQVGYWGTGNVFEGPVHTNGQLNLFGTPVFKGPVSQVDPNLNCPWGCTPDFQQGITKPVAPIPLPNKSMDEIRSNAALIISGNATVELSGTNILVTGSSGGTVSYPVADYPVMMVDGGTLTLAGGELDGQLTLATNGDVIVTGHVRYRCNPEDVLNDTDCLNASTGQPEYNDDLLGIVAGNDVRIGTSAPNNLVIQSTLMALDGALKVDNYNSGPYRGILHVYGGVITKFGGFTGTFNASGPVNGYTEQHGYDQRLLNIAPPYYPTTGRYESVFWYEQ